MVFLDGVIMVALKAHLPLQLVTLVDLCTFAVAIVQKVEFQFKTLQQELSTIWDVITREVAVDTNHLLVRHVQVHLDFPELSTLTHTMAHVILLEP